MLMDMRKELSLFQINKMNLKLRESTTFIIFICNQYQHIYYEIVTIRIGICN